MDFPLNFILVGVSFFSVLEYFKDNFDIFLPFLSF